jgi:hypothetical protein
MRELLTRSLNLLRLQGNVLRAVDPETHAGREALGALAAFASMEAERLERHAREDYGLIPSCDMYDTVSAADDDAEAKRASVAAL